MFKKISLKLMISLAAILLIFAFPQKIYADYSYEETLLYHFLAFPEGEEQWQSKSVCCDELFLSLEEKAYYVFEAFFEEGLACSVPTGTKLLQVKVNDGLLILNVSREIKNYGGTANEKNLIRQIVKTALDIPGLNKVTLFIEGEPDYLPEGSIIEDIYMGNFCIQNISEKL